MAEIDLSGNVRLLCLMPGEVFRYLPDGGEPGLIRFVACDHEGGTTFDELTSTMRSRRTVLGEEFVERFGGAVIEPLGCVLTDPEWAALIAYVRFAADYDLTPCGLMDLYQMHRMLEPVVPPTGQKGGRHDRDARVGG